VLGPAVVCLAAALPYTPAARAATANLTVYVNRSGPPISPTLFGLMFEDINHAGDGGIYAELIANRAYNDSSIVPADWFTETTGHAAGQIDLDTSHPVNTKALGTSLRLTITRVGPGGRVGIWSAGYDGIPVWPSTTYRASFYARGGAGFKGPLTVAIETLDDKVLASASTPAIGAGWRRYTLSLTTRSGVKPSDNNHFVVSGSHVGKVWFSLVSLFPPTWNNRPNGMRVDLMRDLQALHPGFLRFPGGNFLEGQTIDTRFEWKNTIGPLSVRPGHANTAWGYYSSDGLGLLEYLEWCEDLQMTPVLAVYAGYSLSQQHVDPGPALAPYVQDALDEIQYATGSTTTKWGAMRAADGHPAPFRVPYVEIGNEDFFDQSGSYDGRFTQFYDAIRRAYPAIKLIATADVKSRTPDLVDQHFYMMPDWFIANTHYYDGYSRSGPKIMVGEYAARTADSAIGQGPATLGNAIAEAAWLTGLERNADLVQMASYAPLFQNEGDGLYQWTPDLIGFDSLSSYGSPSYYVVQLFSLNHGDRVVPATLAGGGTDLSFVASRDNNGTVYVEMVNASGSAQSVRINLSGVTSVASTGTVSVLTGKSVDDQNSLDAPRTIYPASRTLSGLGRSFTYSLAPDSLTVFQLRA
jgi:alpha-L-arabinofuranosidase